MQVDALAGGVGSHQDTCAIGFAEKGGLAVALFVVHPAVNLGDLAGESLAFQPAHQKAQRVPELGKDEHLGTCGERSRTIGVLFQRLPQFLELAFLLTVVDLAGESHQSLHLSQLVP